MAATLKLSTSLLAHQEEGVGECIKREDHYGRGFLWYAPGLGKTIHMIALSLAKSDETSRVHVPVPDELKQLRESKRMQGARTNDAVTATAAKQVGTDLAALRDRVRVRYQETDGNKDDDHEDKKDNSGSGTTTINDDYPLHSRATLVVCPKSSLGTWRKEIWKHTQGGALVITMSEGDQEFDYAMLAHADFVLVTYGIVLSAFRRVPGADVDLERKQWTERHRSPFDAAVPYDGAAQHALAPVLTLDIAANCTSVSLLFAMRWERLVFDEAHNVRTLKSKRYRAAVRLCARFRWCLTGSPMHNEPVEETFCAFRLAHVPNLTTFGEWSDSVRPDKRAARKKRRRDHVREEERRRYAKFSQEHSHKRPDPTVTAERRYKKKENSSSGGSVDGDGSGDTSHAALFAKRTIEQMALICKTEDVSVHDDAQFRAIMPNGFPDCETVQMQSGFRNVDEKAFYERCRDRLNRTAMRMLSTNSGEEAVVEEDADHVLSSSMMRLRQAAIAAALVAQRRLLHDKDSNNDDCETATTGEKRRRSDKEPEQQPQQQQGSGGSGGGEEAEVPSSIDFILSRSETPWAFEQSTKMQMFRDYAEFTCRRHDNKVLVFSHFLGALDLCENVLNELGVGYVRVDGSVSGHKRHEYIARFQRERNVRVFLVIVKAMGEAVDGLQVACNRVLFLDPWFNPEVEQQALRRILRMGQRKHKVFVTHLVILGTFEERVMHIAASKCNMLEQVCDGHLGRATTDGNDRRWTARNIRDRLLYDDDGYVIEPALAKDVAGDTIAEEDQVTAETAEEGQREQPQDDANTGVDMHVRRAEEENTEVEVESGGGGGDDSGSRKRARLLETMPIGAEANATGATSQQIVSPDLDAWCEQRMSHVMTVPFTALGRHPVAFTRVHTQYERVRGMVFFSSADADLMSVPTFYHKSAFEWLQPNAVLRLHCVSISTLYQLVDMERSVTSYTEARRIAVLDHLQRVLQQQQTRRGSWSRSETTFPPFEAFCALMPQYARACADGWVDGWLCQQEAGDDAPFVVLYEPQRHLQLIE